MYVRHLLHRAITVSVTSGTGSSPSLTVRYGVITSPRGILDFWRRECEVGMVLSVHRW